MISGKTVDVGEIRPKSLDVVARARESRPYLAPADSQVVGAQQKMMRTNLARHRPAALLRPAHHRDLFASRNVRNVNVTIRELNGTENGEQRLALGVANNRPIGGKRFKVLKSSKQLQLANKANVFAAHLEPVVRRVELKRAKRRV